MTVEMEDGTIIHVAPYEKEPFHILPYRVTKQEAYNNGYKESEDTP